MNHKLQSEKHAGKNLLIRNSKYSGYDIVNSAGLNKLLIFGILLIGILAGIAAGLSVEQTVRVTVLPGAIDVYSPVQDVLYLDRMVPINLSMSAEVKYFKYADNGNKLMTLCRNCNEYGFSRLKRKPFDDGFHKVAIYGLFETGNITHIVDFIVDTTKPRITKTSPTRGFATGLFEAEFQEANPSELWLNYGNDNIGWRNAEVDISLCEEKRTSKKCSVNVDLEDYDLEEIKYWFNITDIAENSAKSRERKLDIDVSAPVLNNPETFWAQGEGRNSRYIYFTFNVTEKNFNGINYIDYSERNPRWRLLCSRLKDGTCEKKKSFSRGEHNVSIEILDDAGNRAEFSLGDFDVSY